MREFRDDLRIISSSRHASKPYGKIQSRATHGFIIKLGGEADYDFSGERIHVKKGEMILLPKGSSYEYRTWGEDNLYTSINFLGELDCPEVRVFDVEGFHRLGFISESFSELWRFGAAEERYECLAAFYDLVAFVIKLEAADGAEKGRFALIEPAVEYMRKHIYECSFRVDKLHSRIGISDTYFRRLFKQRFGRAPKEYVTSERLSHARSIIESGDWGSIAEVALTVGYSDPLYFSKAFKRAFGKAPSDVGRGI
ncbi:MAG: helix-turn-helix transcriptional regulator [Clostridia bacterium]|nr:helix-turn-helix transcriptional regulator [Clostridia bacterium]